MVPPPADVIGCVERSRDTLERVSQRLAGCAQMRAILRLLAGRARFDVPALTVRTDGPRAKVEVAYVDVVLAAGILLNFVIGFAQHPGSRIAERMRVKFWVLEQRIQVNVIPIGAS